MMELSRIQADLIQGKTTMVTIVESFLATIDLHANLNAFVHVFREDAIQRARALDVKIKNNESLGMLYGLVVSIKDNICMQGMPVSAGSKILTGYHSPYSATAVERLLHADAIVIGSTNMDQFGMGSESIHSYYGPVRNGKDNALIAGGSSGGAAVSVQMDMCHVALGSDTGGSVRQPASLCDVYGFKPSYGAVSRYGLIAYGSSFDQIGIIAKNSEDIKSVYNVIRGKDEYDSTSIDVVDTKVPTQSKYAMISEMYDEGNSFTNEIKNTALAIYGKDNIDFVSFDMMAYLVPCYYILTTAEASSNLSRYDGVRYGYRSEGCSTLEELYSKTRTEGFGAEVKKRIMLGTFVLSEGYFDAYYTKAQKIRRMIKDQINEILKNYDGIIMPVTPRAAWPIGAKVDNPLEIYLSDIYTVLANITGMPALSIPYQTENGIVNFQIMTHQGHDLSLLGSAIS